MVGAIVALRALMMNLSGPLEDAFSMEILDPSERATTVGLESAGASLLRAGTSFLGATWMAGGDSQSPFLLAAICYIASTILFWIFFRDAEPGVARAVAEQPSAVGGLALVQDQAP